MNDQAEHKTPLSSRLPAEIRGCQWDAGWEFDAPAVVYLPHRLRQYGYGGNVGALDDMVEGICTDLADGRNPHDGGLVRECEWRGWGPRFDRRRNARHVTYRIRWWVERDELQWEITERVETRGLPKAVKASMEGGAK